jgi:predicted RNA-binding Zn ribbon-like protein
MQPPSGRQFFKPLPAIRSEMPATLVNVSFLGYTAFGQSNQTVIPKELPKSRALFIAGHPALDFLNTLMRVNQEFVDLLQTNEDVLVWLKQAELPGPGTELKTAPLSLLRSARRLRETIRSLTEKRKIGRRGDPSVLNSFLAASRGYRQLVWNVPHAPNIEMVWRQNTSASILEPVAEAAADLLATANFTFIKRCDDRNCVLWFSDQTKSHQRRWCSMEMCGNRHKVAAYRKRRGRPLGSQRKI